MEKYYRTDLACETLIPGEKLPPGVEYKREFSDFGFETERMTVGEAAVAAVGKPAGSYITIDCGKIRELDGDSRSALASLISSELKALAERLAGKPLSGNFGVLVVGLGNAEMTPDAIGPGTVCRITATRHLKAAEPGIYEKLGCCAVSATVPGVLGQTGIEAVELVRGAVESAGPDVVLAVDALAARSCGRLASTVQLSDTGISPGSGIGNRRGSISRETLGVPVIALGVPTVIDSSTLVYDALQKAGVKKYPDGLTEVLENGKSYFVAPKDCDVITESICRLLAKAIDDAFGISLEEDA